MKDIENIQDIQLLVDTFYAKVKTNPTIGYFFNDVAKVNWSDHLPKMYDFWNSILFGEAAYKGNPMLHHVLLSKKSPIDGSHFAEWRNIFNETVDELFAGKVAEAAKYKAQNISALMLYKIEQTSNSLNVL